MIFPPLIFLFLPLRSLFISLPPSLLLFSPVLFLSLPSSLGLLDLSLILPFLVPPLFFFLLPILPLFILSLQPLHQLVSLFLLFFLIGLEVLLLLS